MSETPLPMVLQRDQMIRPENEILADISAGRWGTAAFDLMKLYLHAPNDPTITQISTAVEPMGLMTRTNETHGISGNTISAIIKNKSFLTEHLSSSQTQRCLQLEAGFIPVVLGDFERPSAVRRYDKGAKIPLVFMNDERLQDGLYITKGWESNGFQKPQLEEVRIYPGWPTPITNRSTATHSLQYKKGALKDFRRYNFGTTYEKGKPWIDEESVNLFFDRFSLKSLFYLFTEYKGIPVRRRDLGKDMGFIDKAGPEDVIEYFQSKYQRAEEDGFAEHSIHMNPNEEIIRRELNRFASPIHQFLLQPDNLRFMLGLRGMKDDMDPAKSQELAHLMRKFISIIIDYSDCLGRDRSIEQILPEAWNTFFGSGTTSFDGDIISTGQTATTKLISD